MKRRILGIILCLVAVLVLFTSSAAAVSEDDRRVFDQDNILSDSEEEKLQKHIEQIWEKYKSDTVILVVNIENLPVESLPEYCKDFYLQGIKSRYEFLDYGLMIVLNMCDDADGRDYCICGVALEGEESVLGEYFADTVERVTDFQKCLGDGKWYDAFEEVINLSEEFLEQDKTGERFSESNPYKKKSKPMSGTKFTILSLLEVGAGLLFGKGYASKLRSDMNTAVKRTEATEYIDRNSFNITNAQDLFMYSNVTRTRIPTETRSGGGGGGFHSSGGGHSFSGKTGHF